MAMLGLVSVLLASTLLLAPLGAKAADLVVWWEKGYYAQEDAALAHFPYRDGEGKYLPAVAPNFDYWGIVLR
jgi:hypothetical protein